jgi:hypothetical protein
MVCFQLQKIELETQESEWASSILDSGGKEKNSCLCWGSC